MPCQAKKAAARAGSRFHFSQKFSPAVVMFQSCQTSRPSAYPVLQHVRHLPDHVADQVELVVVFERADAVFVGARSERGDDDRERRQRGIAVLEVQVAVSLGDLHDAAEQALKRRIVRERFDAGFVERDRLSHRAAQSRQKSGPAIELGPVALRVCRLPALQFLVRHQFAAVGTGRVRDRRRDVEMEIVRVVEAPAARLLLQERAKEPGCATARRCCVSRKPAKSTRRGR